MPFRFTLAPLLRLRQSIEREQALRLQAANVAVARTQDTLTRLERFLADSAQSDQAGLGAGRRGVELQFASLIRTNLHILREQLLAELRELKHKRQQAAQEYQRAFMEREVLETLRKRQRQAYQIEALRREQREVDAAYLIQLWRKSVG